jgi:hypothetical protein
MSYYHVLITSEESNETYYVWDETNLSKIEETIVVPYQLGTEFRFKGYTLKQSKIKRFRIKKSEQILDKYIEEFDRELRLRHQRNPSIVVVTPPLTKEGILEDDDHKDIVDITDDILLKYEPLRRSRLKRFYYRVKQFFQ